MSLVKAYDVAHVCFNLPDIHRIASFLEDFGMAPVSQDRDSLYMRGIGDAPFLYSARRAAEPGFAAAGLRLNSVEDLHRVAEYDSVAVEAHDAPGGGFVARFIDPDGFVIEAVAGQQLRKPDPVASCEWNEGGHTRRASVYRRIDPAPSHVMRLGHVVLGVSDFSRSQAWYKERFGFVTSDEVRRDGGEAMGAFLRCDRGTQTCDHHTLFLAQLSKPAAFLHAAFEVTGFDDLMVGHEYMTLKGHDHYWGVGRHKLGGQIFDYWLDPWGHQLEHWTDGDQLMVAAEAGVVGTAELLAVQWGMQKPYPSGTA